MTEFFNAAFDFFAQAFTLAIFVTMLVYLVKTFIDSLKGD